jgi:hypothetical protein
VSVSGSRAELCASGYCVPKHFPPGRKRVNGGRDSAGRSWYVEAKRNGLWRFRVSRTPDEREAWVEAEAARQVRAEAPKSAEEWRSNKVSFLKCVGETAWHLLTDPGPRSGGFTLASDALREVESLLAALERTVESAQVVQQAEVKEGQEEVNDSAKVSADVPMPKARAPLRLVASA